MFGNDTMNRFVFGGAHTYGQVAGILMMDSTIPRLPGDPGHAATLPFPVRYGIVRGFPFEDLVEMRRENIGRVINAAIDLEREGVNFVAADCGLFSPFQRDIADMLSVPFLGSALNLIPLISGFLPTGKKVGLITGDTRLLKNQHLAAAGANPDSIVIRGMEKSREFEEVVIKRGQKLDVEALQAGVLTAAEDLFRSGEDIGSVVLECTNLITFRSDIQQQFNIPVFDMVTLIEFFADGYRLRQFNSDYISGSRV
jgi:aspartate/glutamate racemase